AIIAVEIIEQIIVKYESGKLKIFRILGILPHLKDQFCLIEIFLTTEPAYDQFIVVIIIQKPCIIGQQRFHGQNRFIHITSIPEFVNKKSVFILAVCKVI